MIAFTQQNDTLWIGAADLRGQRFDIWIDRVGKAWEMGAESADGARYRERKGFIGSLEDAQFEAFRMAVNLA